MNHQSSRSHTVFRLQIVNHVSYEIEQESILNFIDLAGSENMSVYDKEKDKSDSSTADTRLRKKEGQNINKSLFYLT